jgi:hypothetical protein
MHMRILPITMVIGAALAAVQMQAQAPATASPAAPASQSSSPTAPDIRQPLNNLADQPPTHLGFVFDRSMLQAARNVLESQGMTPERAAASLTSISVDNYRYGQAASYSPESMAAIVTAYRAAGWKHLVNAHEPAADGQARRVSTDLWLHVTGSDIDGLTVMNRGPRDVSVIQVACDLNPLDLVHLGGHFGIPKVDPNAVMVAAPDGK